MVETFEYTLRELERVFFFFGLFVLPSGHGLEYHVAIHQRSISLSLKSPVDVFQNTEGVPEIQYHKYNTRKPR